MKKKTIILILTMLPFLQMQALVFTVDNFKYFAEEGSTDAVLTGYVVSPKGVLTIPSAVTYKGINYSVTKIGDNAFSSCYELTGALTIPASVTAIGNSAFLGCYELTGALTIPASVTTIGSSAFLSCGGLTGALTIPESVTFIGKSAFNNCSSFTGTLTIPASVTTIGEFAFYNCSQLTTAVNYRSTPLAINSNAFLEMYESCILKVPTGSKAAYQAAEGWKEFKTIEEFNPSSVETIEGEAKRFWIEGNRIRLSNSEAVLRIELYNADGQLIGQTTTVPDSHRGVLIVKLFFRDGSVSSGKIVCE